MNRGTAALLVLGLVWAWVGTQGGASAPAQDPATTAQSQPASRPADPGVGPPLLAEFLRDWPGSAPRPAVPLTILIATLPDPHASQLDWAFDSHFDAVRRAFERSGYVMDRYALPWTGKPEARATLPGQPGAVLFRKTRTEPAITQRPGTRPAATQPAEGLRLGLLYLVGELSTGGIDRRALRIALAERRALLPVEQASKEPVRIVGPVFSGSCVSLRMTLESAVEDLGPAGVEILSGAATSPANGSVLRREQGPRITFGSTVHTDRALMGVLIRSVLPELGLERSQVAILQESTTEYGAGLRPGAAAGESFLRIPFPMNLASLRRAYFADGRPAPTEAPLPGRSSPASLALDLQGMETAESVAPRSSLTPAAIDLLLEEITRTLAQRDIRGALLFATDVRDKLFLGRELKKRMPDLQLFTFESNALYVRADFNRWLRGMIVLSTYPLLLRAGTWRPQSKDDHQLAFANEGAEGTFNASALQLDNPRVLADYGHPVLGRGDGPVESALERPPVWATIVGSGTMLPLAVYEPRSRGSAEEWVTPLRAITEVAPERSMVQAASVGFLARAVTAVLALLLVLVAWLDWRQRGQRIQAPEPAPGSAEWPARHERILHISLALHHELYTVFHYFALLGVLLPGVVLLVCAGRWPGANITGVGALGVLVGLVGMAVHASRAVLLTVRYGHEGTLHVLLRSWPSLGQRGWWIVECALRLGVVVMGILYLVLTVWFCVDVVRMRADGQDPERFALFLQRTSAVDQGVSPLVPLMLLGIVLGAWCQWHLRRIRLLALAILPGTASAPAQPAEAGRRRPIALPPAIRDRLFMVLPDPPSALLAAVLALGIVAGWERFARLPDDLVLPNVGAGQSAFALLVRAGIFGTLSAAVWASYRLLSVWRALVAALLDIQRWLPGLPFAKLREELGARPHVSLLPAANAYDLPSVVEARWSRLRAVPEAARFRAPGGVPGRGTGTYAWIFQELTKGGAVPMAGAPMPAGTAAALDVVAAEVVGWVEWTLRHLRHLGFFVLLSIVLTTLLISSYPYQPQALIQTVAFVVFALVVASLVWLIGAMNRNHALSQIAGTKPGELTWDRTLYANLALYAAVPLVTLVSAQFPALRKVLFDWMDPVVRFLVTA